MERAKTKKIFRLLLHSAVICIAVSLRNAIVIAPNIKRASDPKVTSVLHGSKLIISKGLGSASTTSGDVSRPFARSPLFALFSSLPLRVSRLAWRKYAYAE
jgi:hypothetical protein